MDNRRAKAVKVDESHLLQVTDMEFSRVARQKEEIKSVADPSAAEPAPEKTKGPAIPEPEMVSPEVPEPEERTKPAEVAERLSPGRRRKVVPDYRSTFLVPVSIRDRCPTHINRKIYDQIMKFLPVVAREVTLIGFINNVLENHLKQYQDEINELYAKSFSPKPIDYDQEER